MGNLAGEVLTPLPWASVGQWRASGTMKAPPVRAEPSGYPRARSSASLPVPCRYLTLTHPCAANIRGSARGNASHETTCSRQRTPLTPSNEVGRAHFWVCAKPVRGQAVPCGSASVQFGKNALMGRAIQRERNDLMAHLCNSCGVACGRSNFLATGRERGRSRSA